MARHFNVLLEYDGVWVTYVPALDMLSTYGESREEALSMTEEAIAGYLEVAEREGIPLPDGPGQVELVLLDVVA